MSGRNHVPAKDANPTRVPRVQIPHSPPNDTKHPLKGFGVASLLANPSLRQKEEKFENTLAISNDGI